MTTPLKVISIMRRESVDQPWYETTQEFADYFQNTYVNSGKVLMRKVRQSANGLVKKKVVVWANLAEQEAYLKDPVVEAEMQRQRAFAENNNIRLNSKTRIVV